MRAAEASDAAALAALHRAAFPSPWSEAELADLMQDGAFALVEDGQGFILCRTVLDEAEILTVAVDPAARRLGLGRRLVLAAAGRARKDGAASFFLEVAVDNLAAIGLYETTDFAQVGLRRGYYRRPDGDVDALVMRRDLNT
ncbi:ribosomal protein S18-alanine N-acetyltransferase [Caulobacter segnis]|uniref:ribosomal protein S18-alanine N-acetyltransferase n=1 Tax=Caulobacter segnis TaxID=88688 RepID=UPI00240EB085|nr:ribosomal protein S18-alanine N-acetyltransferase [Caulobacter segnis]MDG2521492.1 ribosomal protein S18-alanine N-acetyltransferase [Caulobacter segnis]